MTNTIPNALRILSHFWLEEIKPSDLDTIAALPSLAETLPSLTEAALTDLAVEYQRLFGFNLPPYESIFVDPSVMLQAPSTAAVQTLYQQGRWVQPVEIRAGAPDHIGVELRVLADWLSAGKTDMAEQLLTQHVAVWVPIFALTLRRLLPHPFYAELAELTTSLILNLLPENMEANPTDFPILSEPSGLFKLEDADSQLDENDEEVSLRQVIRQLLIPCNIGLYLTREDVARISQTLDLSIGMGDRYRMLETLFYQAGQYDLVPTLFEELTALFDEAGANYQEVVAENSTWLPYSSIWYDCLNDAKMRLGTLIDIVSTEPENH